MTEYVLGFLFRDNATSVVLIRKEKPQWQAGLLNGVGGKIDAPESALTAMIREFREETGVDTNASGWEQFCEMSGEDFAVYCFKAFYSDAWARVESTTSEKVGRFHPDNLTKHDCVSNLHWLIELAIDNNYGKPMYATVRYSPPFKPMLSSRILQAL